MARPRSQLILALLLGALSLGSLAAVTMAGEPGDTTCPAEAQAAAIARPGFVVMAGAGDPACDGLHLRGRE